MNGNFIRAGLGALLLGLIACDKPESTLPETDQPMTPVQRTQTYERQLEVSDAQLQATSRQLETQQEQLNRSEEQLERADAQFDRAEEQSKRMDALLDQWEQQARRFDAILDQWERIQPPESAPVAP